ATLLAIFRNASGAQVHSASAKTVGTLMQRVSVSTFAAPATARTVDVTVTGHLVATRPQVTWTTRSRPWEIGGGATSVVIDKFSASQAHLDGQVGLLRNATMTLKEVG